MTSLPNGWERLRLGDIAARTKNIDPSRAPKETYELYSVPSFSNGRPDHSLGVQIKSSKQAVQADDVLLCKIVPHINRVWTVAPKSSLSQIASGEWIVYREHHSDPHYLRYCLTEQSFRDKFMETVSGVGGSLMRARPSKVAEIEIPLAPLSEQRRIVAKIESLTGKSKSARDRLDHIPRLVEKYKQAVLGAAFRGDLTREWRLSHANHEDAKKFSERRQMEREKAQYTQGLGRDERAAQIDADDDLRNALAIATEENPLPETWLWSSLGLVFEVYVGATPSRKDTRYWNGLIPWVSSGEVAFCRVQRTHEMITDLGLRESSTRLHPPGTILVGMIGEGKTRGQAAILEIRAANNQNCAAVRVAEAGYSSAYLYWYLWMSYAQTRRVGSGNNQQALNKDRVQRLLFPLAPALEALEIANRIEQLFKWIDRLAAGATSARKLVNRLDQAILAKAFRGELVPQDPNDEPASVLLDRIRCERASTSAAKPQHKAKK